MIRRKFHRLDYGQGPIRYVVWYFILNELQLATEATASCRDVLPLMAHRTSMQRWLRDVSLSYVSALARCFQLLLQGIIAVICGDELKRALVYRSRRAVLSRLAIYLLLACIALVLIAINLYFFACCIAVAAFFTMKCHSSITVVPAALIGTLHQALQST